MDIASAIEKECTKLISRHQHKAALAHAIGQRFRRATGTEPGPPRLGIPAHWELGQFNPYRVRNRRLRAAHAIEVALRAREYDPAPALIQQLPKPDGGYRQVSIFAVADSAVASLYFCRILKRNQSRLSPFSYAYRADIGLHDAVERLWREQSFRKQFWTVEFDFSKYFDTISHSYLLGIVRKHFRLTHSEIQVIQAFLRSRRAFSLDHYRRGSFSAGSRGIPQGNSLSLFLANVACHELDLALTRGGLVHARYADDVIVLSKTEAEAGIARELIMRHCDEAGLAVNFDKSPGVRTFGPEGLATSGSTTKSSFDYLGHTFGYRLVHRSGSPAAEVVRRLSIRARGEKRIRQRLSGIIFSHLLRYPLAGLFARTRVDAHNGIDWDLVTCINDMRGYVYGGLSEDDLTRRSGPLQRSEGVAAFYPLINDVEQLKSLDGWLLHALGSAVEARQRLLRARFALASYPVLTPRSLEAADWYNSVRLGIDNCVRIPSFVRAWKYAQRCMRAFNLRELPSRPRQDDNLYK